VSPRSLGAVPPKLPPARALELPRRGRTWVIDSGPAPDRPVLLLLHGWTSTAALNFWRCIPPLAEHFRVVAMDHRGHGRGIRSRWFRLEDCADDAAAVAAELRLGRVTAVGYSMGGPVAQLLWRRHPGRVEALVLCATADTFPVRQLAGPWPAMAAGAVGALALVPPALRRAGMRYATARWSAANSASDWSTEEWSRSDPAAILQAGVALSRYDASRWISAIDVPTAVVVTEQDVTVPPARQRRMAAAIRGSRVFPVHGDHRACVDAPEQFVPVLLDACRWATSARRPVPYS
jgi:3-oxoadipate enol-lactonase